MRDAQGEINHISGNKLTVNIEKKKVSYILRPSPAAAKYSHEQKYKKGKTVRES